MSADMQRAVRLVLNMLPDQAVTSEIIRDEAEAVVGMLQRRDQAPELQDLIRHVEELVNVRQDGGASLVDPAGHEAWLGERRAQGSWEYWDRYRLYLEDVQQYPRAVVLRLDDVTDSILSKLEDPRRKGPWDRRGLVVGQVQSGKTSNYTGLVCKAADAGYKLIVVLAGIHNSLRSQTQLRLDEGFLGFDSQAQTRDNDGDQAGHYIGAGAMPGVKRLRAGSLTTSAETGDFKTAAAQRLALPIGDMPVILVIKKHAGIIRNVHTWITTMHGEVVAPNRKVVSDIPLLVIDDEADNASIDTSKEESEDPTAINRELRRLLHSFDKSAYVGYTATPFANIYASPDESHATLGEDIFPRSFIEVLRAPSNYFGPERVFGLDSEERGAIPIHRTIDDFDEWMPNGHKKHWLPPRDEFPESLREAVLDFVLTCAARRARGQAQEHNSMLIHVTRFQDVQERVKEQVEELLLFVKDRIRHGDGDGPSLIEELYQRWDQQYVPTSSWFREDDPALDVPEWEKVRAELHPAVTKIQLRTMNGKSRDALDYYENRNVGLSVIAIGGDKLSRGLTLEGLTVSYYLRASKMYDTLMQMGRWFGYRPRYEDLCRLYTTADLRSWYREITQASDELRAELEEMAAQGATPRDYGLRVRTSPAGLSVTAANKMRRAQKVRLSFSGANPETVLFDVRTDALSRNRAALETLVAALGASSGVRKGNPLWTGDIGLHVGQFLEAYKSDPMAWRVRPDLIASYIRRCINAGELDDFSVALINNQNGGSGRTSVAGHDIGLTKRALLPDGEVNRRQRELEQEHRYAIRRILSPPDELLDLDDVQVAEALAGTVRDWEADPRDRAVPTAPSGPRIRATRRSSQGLMLIYVLTNAGHEEHVGEPMVGFFLSFPHSEHDIAAEYAVNPVWQQLQAEGLIDDEQEA